MIIPKKAKGRKRKKIFIQQQKSVNFELKDFANISIIGKRRKSFKIKNFFKKKSIF